MATDTKIVRRKASTFTKRRVTFLWDRMVPKNSLSLWPGMEGIGKSTLAARIIADLTRGTLPGEYYGKPQTCWVMYPEDGVEELWTARLEGMGADMDRVEFIGFGADGESLTRYVLPRDISAICREMHEEDVAFLWVDSLVNSLDGDHNTDNYKDTASALGDIHQAAVSHRVTIAAGWHTNKSNEDNRRSVMGSAGLQSATRAVLMFGRDSETDEVVVAVTKANGFSREVPPYRYSLETYEFELDEVDDSTGQIVTVPGEVGQITQLRVGHGIGWKVLEDLRAAAKASETPRMVRGTPTPDKWLIQALRDGPRPSNELKKAAKQEHGWSDSKMKYAGGRIGVVVTYESGHADGHPTRRSIWALPPSVQRMEGNVYELDFSRA